MEHGEIVHAKFSALEELMGLLENRQFDSFEACLWWYTRNRPGRPLYFSAINPWWYPSQASYIEHGSQIWVG